MTYKYVSAITYLNPSVRDYLLRIKVPKKKLYFLPVGADFELFKPASKKIARKKLGLDQGAIYGIYVGAFYKLKSVDVILKVHNELKTKYNFSVIFVGGEDNKLNDLYQEVRDSGCPFFGWQKWTDMVDFYNAADFYIHPAFHPSFGGLDVSWMEALACNKPVLSPQLGYLDFDYSEVGILIDDKKEISEKTEWMINNYSTFIKCRETAQKHLDGNTAIMEKLINIYNEVLH